VPARGRGHGGGGEEPPARGPRAHAHAGSMRQGENSVEQVSEAGRVGGPRPAASSGSGTQANDLVTSSTGRPGGTPDGHPTRIQTDDDAATTRSIEMENSGAVTLANQGWQVRQNPTPREVAQARQETGDTGNPDSNPDYLVEGRVFDAFSPTKPTKSVRNIWTEIEDKVVERRQTQRAVINLEDWRGDMSALRKQFADWPIPGLKEVKAITPDGDIVQIDLP